MPTMQEEFTVEFLDMTGGRNDSLPPHDLAMNECVDAVNMTWDQTRFCQKRNGMSAAPLTGNPFTTNITGMFRHVPGNDDGQAELWAVGGIGAANGFARVAGGTAWAVITAADPIFGPPDISWVTFQGKLFIAYANTANRMHCWDGTSLRRVGVAVAPAPTVFNDGAGTYPPTLRYYKVSYVQITGADTVRRSELSPAVAFTPSGNGTSANVVKPAAVGDGETHWEVWGSKNNAEFYRLASLPIGTTSYFDSAAPANYLTLGPLAPDVGENRPPEAWRFVAVHQNRLLGAGAFPATGTKHNRVWFTPQSGASDVGDDERVQYTTTSRGWVDVNERDGDTITGLVAFQGVVVVFKRRHVYKLVPTQNPMAPYVVVEVNSGGVGCVSSRTIVEGEDEVGSPALYFCGERGVYRISQSGVQFCSRNFKDLWANLILTPEAYGSILPNLQLFALWYEAKAQYWLFAAVRGETTGVCTMQIFHARYGRLGPDGVTGGWTRYLFQNQDAAAGATLIPAAVMFSRTIGAPMSQALAPYLTHYAPSSAPVVLADDPAATTDEGVAFGAHIRLPEKAFAGYGRRFSVRRAFVVGKVLRDKTGTFLTPPTLEIRYSIDFGLASRRVTWTLARQDVNTSQERRIWYVEDAEAGDCGTVEIRIGDATPAATGAWQLEGARFLMQAQQTP